MRGKEQGRGGRPRQGRALPHGEASARAQPGGDRGPSVLCLGMRHAQSRGDFTLNSEYNVLKTLRQHALSVLSPCLPAIYLPVSVRLSLYLPTCLPVYPPQAGKLTKALEVGAV